MRNPFVARTDPWLVRARIGVFGTFATSGFAMGAWAAGLPALDERLHLGPGRLGTVLLLIAGGAMVSMLVAGRLSDRFSSRVITRILGPTCAVALLGPALAPSFGALAVAAVVYGLTLGIVEVAMNVNSVEVEARYQRPIVSAFHGLWSMGGAAGGALTALGLLVGLDSQLMLVLAITAALVAFVWFGRMLLPPPPPREPAAGETGSGSGTLRWGLVLLLGVVAFSGHISEGAAIDWAAVHARRVLDTPLSSAPIAYTAFGVAMTVVRLLGDPIRARLGSARTLLLAGTFATAGYGLVLLSPLAVGFELLVACAGWVLTGMGLATVVPIVFSAVGASGGAVGKALAMVTVFGSAGLLVGPALIGHLAELTSLPAALVVPALLSALVAISGPPAVKALGVSADIATEVKRPIPEAV